VTYVLALDQGTTGSTCLVLDEGGRVVGRGYREITQFYPEPGWVEHDPAELIDRTVDAAREALARAGIGAESVAAIGVTNQRETAIAWEPANPRAAPRAIVWQDRRTADRCARLAADAGEITRTTGLTIDPYFSGTKFAWLLERHGWTDRAARGEVLLGTVDSWLIWNLTGGRVHATDPTNASRTMLFDIDRRQWSDAMAVRLGVPLAALPEVRRSSGSFGETRAFGAPIPIMGVAGDQQAALFGQGCVEPGAGKVTYGTGAFLLLNTGTVRPSTGGGLLATLACDAEGGPCYAVEAAIFVAGAAVQWLRDGLGLIETAGETEALARGVPSTDGVYFVPALTGLGAPHWEPRARGTIVGITRGTTRAHLARAALEAMAYSTNDVMAAMRGAAGDAPLGVLRVDGGAAQNDWLMQFQADVLGLPVERPTMIETTALGAAGLAGLASGVWRTVDEFRGACRFTRFEPRPGGIGGEGEAARAGAREWGRAVKAALYWARNGGD
jgi:glycerol kinase